MLIEDIIKYVEENPSIKWNNINSLKNVDIGWESQILNNKHELVSHGYFTLLHRLVSTLPNDAKIVEFGNREGFSTVAILDALKDSQRFFTVDIVEDLRCVNKELCKDNTKFLFGDVFGDHVFNNIPNQVDLFFFDTLHTYEQVSREFNTYKLNMKNGCIILVDDINLNDKRRFYDEYEGKKYDLTNLCHSGSGFGAFIYEN